jgi:fructose-1,6-bisphosphatase-3
LYKEKYYDILAEKFNSKDTIISEIINLEAILNLPKGTEFFISDIHGEFDGFNHILKTGAGNIRDKISLRFGGQLTEKEQSDLAFLVAYPDFFISKRTEKLSLTEKNDWYYQQIYHSIELIKYCATKYSQSKLRKALPEKYAYIIEELINVNPEQRNKEEYYEKIINKIIELDQAHDLLIELSMIVQKLVIDHIHIVGDVYDRGYSADEVMACLMRLPSVDVQWGNHDLLWMAGYSGSKACLMTLLRIATRYGYLFSLEEAYGLNLRPLFLFSEKYYQPIHDFEPKNTAIEKQRDILSQVHQALAIIQFKLEGQIIQRRPEFEMSDRLLLDKINFDTQTITLNGKEYDLLHQCFQTVDPQNPYELTAEEEYIVSTLLHSFQKSEKLQREINFLYDSGHMYLIYNRNLLFHGCIPLDEEGQFQKVSIGNKTYAGKELLDILEHHIRKPYENITCTDDFSTDLMWYSWCGKYSPLFGKSQMTTFERYFIEDKKTHVENKNPYYTLREKEETCCYILNEFGLNTPESAIINGHTPIKVRQGESPIKAGGKLLVIDGGMSAAYQKTTGIAGYTLLNNSYGFQIVTHQPFSSIEEAYQTKFDTMSLKKMIDSNLPRKKISDTTIGDKLSRQIEDLNYLLKYVKFKEKN